MSLLTKVMGKDSPNTSLTGSPANAPLDNGADAASRLLESHKQLTESGEAKRGRGRPPGSKNKTSGQQSAPPTTGANYLPPTSTLPQVMASATGLFYTLHAAFSGDEDWMVTDAIKREMGDILAWMLADDFYKVGGLGKYVVGGIMFMGVYAAQAVKTAPKRLAKINASRLAKTPKQNDAGTAKPEEKPIITPKVESPFNVPAAPPKS